MLYPPGAARVEGLTFLFVILSDPERSEGESKDPYSCKNHSVAAWPSSKLEIVGGHRGPSTPRDDTQKLRALVRQVIAAC
jgi:hypothetical protein